MKHRVQCAFTSGLNISTYFYWQVVSQSVLWLNFHISDQSLIHYLFANMFLFDPPQEANLKVL